MNPFDPTGTEGAIELPADLGYHYLSGEVSFQSDRRKQFWYNMEVGYGTQAEQTGRIKEL